MRVEGQFTTAASIETLRGLQARPERLGTVPTLDGVEPQSDGSLTALFTPATPFGRAPMAVRISTEQAHADGTRLRVNGRRGPHTVDVLLTVNAEQGAAGTAVRWAADVTVRGPGVSVGQRVAEDVARRAIGDVLVSAAECA